MIFNIFFKKSLKYRFFLFSFTKTQISLKVNEIQRCTVPKSGVEFHFTHFVHFLSSKRKEIRSILIREHVGGSQRAPQKAHTVLFFGQMGYIWSRYCDKIDFGSIWGHFGEMGLLMTSQEPKYSSTAANVDFKALLKSETAINLIMFTCYDS